MLYPSARQREENVFKHSASSSSYKFHMSIASIFRSRSSVIDLPSSNPTNRKILLWPCFLTVKAVTTSLSAITTFFFFLIAAAPTHAAVASVGLSDPDQQPKFVQEVPNPLDPSFIYDTSFGYIEVSVSEGIANTGLVGNDGSSVSTPIWGYGVDDEVGYTWPGRTFVVQAHEDLQVKWQNNIPIGPGYLLTGKDNGLDDGNFLGRSVVDETFHWAFSIHGYQDYSIETHGTPIVTHLHGGHTDAPFDGNPEYFFTPGFAIKGPRWVSETYSYDNIQRAASLWYHDHALGITRLNVYAGMAGFYIIRDEQDTGEVDNPLNLPAFPYELPLVVQDRMFKENGELFYPAFKGDPFYEDFVTAEGATIGDDAPSGLAEFFGDHMVVNGKIWPKAEVEPRKYRLRLLNGCDSRYLVIQFVTESDDEYLSFTVIGGDDGLVTSTPETVDTFVFEPSARYDVIIDFAPYRNKRIIMKNIGGDEPFGGDIPGPQAFEHTDKVMAFDVTAPLDSGIPDNFDPESVVQSKQDDLSIVDRVRRLGLFEGRDQFGRLQPLLGTVDPATDENGSPINWPDTVDFLAAGVTGQMVGSVTWDAPTTEIVRLGDVEEWEIWNLSADAHPIHLHLVQLEVVNRKHIVYDSAANADGGFGDGEGPPIGDGTYIMGVPLVQHDGSVGEGYMVMNPTEGETISEDGHPEYVTNMPKDVVVSLPQQITTIRARFDKPGRFNWHCHILSHEDHEMMRVFHVADPASSCVEDLIFSDRACYEINAVKYNIQITFINCEPRQGDWIGIYPEDPDRNLDDLGEPVDWFWTCGTRTWPERSCDEPVGTGVVLFNVDVPLLEGTYVAYMVRIVPDGLPYPAYEASESFVVTSTGC